MSERKLSIMYAGHTPIFAALIEMTPEEKFEQFLSSQGYKEIHILKDGIYVCLSPFLFTWAIIIGSVGDKFGYTDRWCYHNYADALGALFKWLRVSIVGEPEGWHRHPASGRRMIDGKLEAYD